MKSKSDVIKLSTDTGIYQGCSMIKIWSFLCLVLFVSQSVAASDRFRLAIPDSAYPPYVVNSPQQGHYQGVMVETIEPVLADLNVSLKIQSAPIKRFGFLLESGEIDALIDFPNWVDNPDQMLWLDLGLWVEDRLYYALNAPKPPQDIQQLDNAEIITHMGYNYPEFERYFAASKAARIDQYTNAEMLKALYASPRGSRRYMIMDKAVLQWHLNNAAAGQEIELESLFISCSPLKIRLANTEKMRQLQPLMQEKIKQQRDLNKPKHCLAVSQWN